MTTLEYTPRFVVGHCVLVKCGTVCLYKWEREAWFCGIWVERDRERKRVWGRNKRRLNLPIDRYRIDVLMHNAFYSLHTTVEDRSKFNGFTTKGVM